MLTLREVLGKVKCDQYVQISSYLFPYTHYGTMTASNWFEEKIHNCVCNAGIPLQEYKVYFIRCKNDELIIEVCPD